MSIDDRTSKALGEDIMEDLRSLRFCIVGCGGTGASFADMLVRTGALRLTLIDGSRVEDSNLNRVFSFFPEDCGKNKVEVLKKRLESIRPDRLKITAVPDSFRRLEDILDTHSIGQQVRDAVCDADVVFIGTDTNKSRLAIEKLSQDEDKRMYLSCGVRADAEAGVFELECAWLPETPPERDGDEGYGPENASFASIVHEAVSVAFTMLLSHLKRADSSFKSYYRRYDGNFQPVETVVNERSSSSTPRCLGPRHGGRLARRSSR